MKGNYVRLFGEIASTAGSRDAATLTVVHVTLHTPAEEALTYPRMHRTLVQFEASPVTYHNSNIRSNGPQRSQMPIVFGTSKAFVMVISHMEGDSMSTAIRNPAGLNRILI